MNLIPWRRKPAHSDTERSYALDIPLTRLQRSIDRMFDQFLRDPFGWNDQMPTLFGETAEQWNATWLPTIDVAEKDDAIVVRAEVPGVNPEDINVSVSGNVLTISGEKKESFEEKREDYAYAERRFGSFRRSIELPSAVDVDRIAAECSAGVLTVRVPRTEPARRRQIEVKPTATRTHPTSTATATTQSATRKVPVGAA